MSLADAKKTSVAAVMATELAVKNQIGPYECDRQKVCPITFQVFLCFFISFLNSPFLSKNLFLWTLYLMNLQNKSKKIYETFHLACQVTCLHVICYACSAATGVKL